MFPDTKLRTLMPKDKTYKLFDRDGLYVAVLPLGAVSFRYNYRIWQMVRALDRQSQNGRIDARHEAISL